MSIWIANRNQNNQYIFTEGLELQQQELKEVRVGAEKYYRNIIHDSAHTFYVYTVEKLAGEELTKLHSEWNRFCSL